jgi:hypothetical protein
MTLAPSEARPSDTDILCRQAEELTARTRLEGVCSVTHCLPRFPSAGARFLGDVHGQVVLQSPLHHVLGRHVRFLRDPWSVDSSGLQSLSHIPSPVAAFAPYGSCERAARLVASLDRGPPVFPAANLAALPAPASPLAQVPRSGVVGWVLSNDEPVCPLGKTTRPGAVRGPGSPIMVPPAGNQVSYLYPDRLLPPALILRRREMFLKDPLTRLAARTRPRARPGFLYRPDHRWDGTFLKTTTGLRKFQPFRRNEGREQAPGGRLGVPRGSTPSALGTAFGRHSGVEVWWLDTGCSTPVM